MAIPANQHVVIVNRNYPPRKGVTGESACLLAESLNQNPNLKISVVTVRSNYAGGGSSMEPVGEVHEIVSFYDGKQKILRLFSGFLESALLIWKAKRLRGTVTIVMTDPVFLSAIAAVLLRNKNWALWSMDLYPDAFISSNLVQPTNPLYRLLHWIVYRSPPQFLIALGKLQADYLNQQYRAKIPNTILPCGVFQPASNVPYPAWKKLNQDKIILGYCGNLGEAHSVDFLKFVLKHLDPKKYHLVLSVYGAKAQRFLDQVDAQQSGITMIDGVSRQQLCLIDIHLVSLLTKWSHVCVPSKAVSAVCSGSAFVFYGTQNCDNWDMLGEAGWLIDEADATNLDSNVKNLLGQIDHTELQSKKTAARKIGEMLNDQVIQAFSRIGEMPHS
ncbi:MAG: hypothetical protein AAGA30_13510 [Planctomycetota bacterium]